MCVHELKILFNNRKFKIFLGASCIILANGIIFPELWKQLTGLWILVIGLELLP